MGSGSRIDRRGSAKEGHDPAVVRLFDGGYGKEAPDGERRYRSHRGALGLGGFQASRVEVWKVPVRVPVSAGRLGALPREEPTMSRTTEQRRVPFDVASQQPSLCGQSSESTLTSESSSSVGSRTWLVTNVRDVFSATSFRWGRHCGLRLPRPR